jgi:peptide/nickel transport system ATP-binding protein
MQTVMPPSLERIRKQSRPTDETFVLRVRDLETRFFTKSGVVHAVNGVSFDLKHGERMAVVGESGSGKSVMAMSLMRLVAYPGRITGGEVELNGRSIMGLASKELNRVRGKEVAMVFQDPMTSLNPVLRIEEQIVPPMMRHLGLSAGEARERALELLRQVGISDESSRLRLYPHELSGGMRQRALIAIALSCKPDLILADEPTTALDVTIQAQIVSLLKQLAQDTGAAVLFVTHDLGLVARFAQKVAVMYAGRFVEYGAVRDIFSKPQHPYTRGLLGSIQPMSGPRQERLVHIDGAPPDMKALGSGCAFAARCPLVESRCWLERPELTERGTGHTAACFVTAGELAAKEAAVGIPG